MMKNDMNKGEIPITSEVDIVSCRKAVRIVATKLKFGITDITRLVTVTSELARNIFVYAGSGSMRWVIHGSGIDTCFELTFEDHGPGIPDINQAMQEGYTSGKGLGLGLPGVKRLMDEMEISSTAGKETTVKVKKWLKKK